VPGSGGTSGFAIASLIFGILGGVLFGTIFGIVALVQIRKRGQTGRGMAIAGLTLSGCWILLIVIAVTFAIVTGATDDSTTTASGNTGTSVATPTTTKAKANGAVGVADLKPGHCIKAIKASVNIEDLPVVSCAVRHEGEVYAVFKLPAGPFPGTAAVQKQAEKGCIAKLKTYAPKAPDSVEVFYLAPLELSWSRDRGVTCIATDDRGPTTGSLHK
jgi:hypothetical protein